MKKNLILLFAVMVAFQLWAQDTIEVVNIENRAVRDYMADAQRTYTQNDDYKVSVVTKYNNSDIYGKKLYWPNGKLVTWEPTVPPEEIKEILITVGEREDYKGAYTFNPDENDVSSYMIRNLLPNRLYYYKVEEIRVDGTVTQMAHGKFRTEGQVRMIQVRNNSNIRDLGGWPTQYGVPVRYGRLYRSGSLERTTRQGRHDFVDNLGVVAELDLRHEVKRTTSCLGEDKDYLRISHGMYLSGIKEKNDVYVTDLRWVIMRLHEGKNVDWHCAIGCDRCGTLSFLVEGLLGLSELDLCRDYELSTFSLSRKNKRVRSPLKSMLNHIRTFGPKDDLAKCFYNYWLSIGMEKRELDYFLHIMLGVKNDSSRIGTRSQVVE